MNAFDRITWEPLAPSAQPHCTSTGYSYHKAPLPLARRRSPKPPVKAAIPSDSIAALHALSDNRSSILRREALWSARDAAKRNPAARARQRRCRGWRVVARRRPVIPYAAATSRVCAGCANTRIRRAWWAADVELLIWICRDVRSKIQQSGATGLAARAAAFEVILARLSDVHTDIHGVAALYVEQVSQVRPSPFVIDG